MESHRFLYAMRIDQPPLIYRDESQSGGDAHPTDLHDILLPFSSMLRDWGIEEEKERAERKEREQKKHEHEHEHNQKYEGKGKGKQREEEQEQVATPPVGEPHTERAFHSAFRALQLPSVIFEAEFIHFAVQFVFTTYADLQRFQDASDLDYEEDALAASFSADYARALWPDGAPEGDNTSAWLKNLAHFFSVLRRGPYIRGGTTATLEELLFRLVGEERVEASSHPSGHHVDPWNNDPVDTVETELTEAHRDLGLTEVDDGRVQDFIDLAAAYAFEFYGSLDSESADLQDLGDLYDPGPLAEDFYTTFRIVLWEGSEEADHVYDTRMAGLRRFFFALQARNYMREGSVSLRNCLVRLVGLKVANTIKLPGFAQETTGSNPILSALFVKLDVSQDLPHDRPMLDAFQNAVTNIAFQAINDPRRENKRPHTRFGPNAPYVSPEKITSIIHQVVDRYATKLWPEVVGVHPLPYNLLMALEAYIYALIQIPAERAPRDGEDTMRVFDNMLGLDQDKHQAGFPGPIDDEGDEADDEVDDEVNDGLECPLKELATSRSCWTPFLSGVELGHHLIEVHDFIGEDARDAVREAEIARKERLARRY